MQKTLIALFLLINFLLCSFLAHSFNKKEYNDIKTYSFAFSKKDHFHASYADYPAGQDDFFELQFENGARLPLEVNPKGTGLKLSGNNHSDDLFMYTYKKLHGLKPNTTYHVTFSLEFASNASNDTLGVGGSPADSVFVKIGAVTHKPQRYVDAAGYYRMGLDKGNQMVDGNDMITIGDVGVDSRDHLYRLKTLPFNPDPDMQKKLEHFTVTSNENGHVWLILGTDSGFESTTTLYYTHVVAKFKEMPYMNP